LSGPSRVFGVLLLRDLHVARRELPYFLVRTTLQPLLFVLVFGTLLPKMGFVNRGYTAALLPGILAISLAFSSLQAVALPMMADFGFTKAVEVFLIIALGATGFSALGLFLGTAIQGQQIGLMFSVIVAPMIMFGCAYYPWSGLKAVPLLKWAVLVNPLVYVSEGLRAALTPALPHMPVPAVLLALAALTGVFWVIGLRTFRKRSFS
jgi:ABC-2 type transport system permease protein